MERKHYVRMNPGLQLGASWAAGQDQGARTGSCLPVPRAGTKQQERSIASAPPVPPPTSSNSSNHFGFALIKGLAPSGCFFLYTEPATRGRFFFSGIACKSRMSNVQVLTTGRKTLQGEFLGTHQPGVNQAEKLGSRHSVTPQNRLAGSQEPKGNRPCGSSESQGRQACGSLLQPRSLGPAHGTWTFSP